MRNILWLSMVALLSVGSIAFAQTSSPMIASATGDMTPIPHHSGAVTMHVVSAGPTDLDQIRAAQELAAVMQFDWVSSVFAPTTMAATPRAYPLTLGGDTDSARAQAELSASMQVTLESTTTVFPTDVIPVEEPHCQDFDECRAAEELAAIIQS